MQERIKLKNENNILENSELDEMYKLKLQAFFLKRNYLNSFIIVP